MIAIKTYFTKILLAVILLLVTLIYINYRPQNLKLFQKYYLNQNIKFYKGLRIYEKVFKTKGIIKEEGLLSPVINTNISTGEPYLDGMLFQYDTESVINAYNSGIVVFTGNKDNYGNTIIIQGIDGIDIWYGNITDSSVNLYDYVEKGKIIGKPKDNKLYLKMEKSGNPIDVNSYLNEI